MATSILRLTSKAPKPTSTSPLSAHHRHFTTTPQHRADFTHVVIGAGAVGLAIARNLASRPGTSTLLIERHGLVGSETSSRNSEVIHAGLYYGHNTLKTNLCIRGKKLLYDLCERQGIPYLNTRKWIVAQDDQQMEELEKIHQFAREVNVPTTFLSRREHETREPDIRAQAGVLESSSTGIVDSHSLMTYLEGSFLDSGGEIALHTTITGISHSQGTGEYEIQTSTTPSSSSSSSGESEVPNDPITTTNLINSSGLSAIPISNLLLPPSHHLTPYYAKGNYYSYSASFPKPTTLIYPAPVPGHGGLGTHLTLDLSGRIRFGPDVEWTSDPNDLTPSSDPSRLREAISMIKTYLPGVDESAIGLDYCGIRPKLREKASGTAGPSFEDFYIREESGKGFPGFVNLLGIESPGLTSCLAIGEYVGGILYGDLDVKGLGEGEGEGKEVRFEMAQ